MIVNDTHYCDVGGDSDHRLLCLQLNIDCSFVKPQHKVEIQKFFPRFKYDKSKVEEYQLALITSFGNLCVVDSIGHLGGNKLSGLLQQCMGATTESTFGSKPLARSYRKKHCHKPWFDTDYCIVKGELRFWLKANPHL
jgi:hypothetical protein